MMAVLLLMTNLVVSKSSYWKGQGYGDDIKYCPAGRQEEPINVNYKTIVAYEECVLHMCLPAQRIHMFYHFMTF